MGGTPMEKLTNNPMTPTPGRMTPLIVEFFNRGIGNPGAVKFDKVTDSLGNPPVSVHQVLPLFFGEVDGRANEAGNLDRTAGAGLVVPLSLCHAGHNSKQKGLFATLIDIHKGLGYYSGVTRYQGWATTKTLPPPNNLVFSPPRTTPVTA